MLIKTYALFIYLKLLMAVLVTADILMHREQPGLTQRLAASPAAGRILQAAQIARIVPVSLQSSQVAGLQVAQAAGDRGGTTTHAPLQETGKVDTTHFCLLCLCQGYPQQAMNLVAGDSECLMCREFSGLSSAGNLRNCLH